MFGKKWGKGVGLGLVAALTLSACAGTTAEETASTDAAPAASGEVITLTMVESLAFPERSALMRGLLDDFEAANPDIKIDLVSPHGAG